jgi:hypothetical protein
MSVHPSARRNIAALARQIFVKFCIACPHYNLSTKLNFGYTPTKVTTTRVDLCVITTTSLTDAITVAFVFKVNVRTFLLYLRTMATKLPFTRVAGKSLARPGRKQATATEDFYFHISYL